MIRVWPLLVAVVAGCSQAAATEFRVEAISDFTALSSEAAPAPVVRAFRGGVRLHWDRKNFRGFSGLTISAGTRVTAVSDRGAWFQGRLVLKDGLLVGIVPSDLKRLDGPDGKNIKRSDADAEAVASDGRGGFVVAFERRGRLLNYPPWRKPFTQPPRYIAPPPDLVAFPPNAGIEALARLCDGGLFAIAQRAGGEKPDAWVLRDGIWESRRYRRQDGFAATGATLLPDCSVAVLERRDDENGMEWFQVRQVSAAELEAGHVGNMTTQPLIASVASGSVRFEGIAADRSARGPFRVYLISDSGKSDGTVIVAFDMPRPAQ